MEVGKMKPKEVSEVNHELYTLARKTLEENTNCWHIGWEGVGRFIDILEEEYDIKRKE